MSVRGSERGRIISANNKGNVFLRKLKQNLNIKKRSVMQAKLKVIHYILMGFPHSNLVFHLR